MQPLVSEKVGQCRFTSYGSFEQGIDWHRKGQDSRSRWPSSEGVPQGYLMKTNGNLLTEQWDFSRPMFVAYEPWETRLAAGLLKSISKDGAPSDPMLLVADPYQVINRRSAKRLTRLSQSIDRLEVLFDALPNWEVEIRRASATETEESWDALAQEFSPQRLELCMKSDVYLFPRERTPYHYPMGAHQKKKAALLVLNRILAVFEQFQPDAVVMIEDQYLAKNFVGLLSEQKDIPIRVVRSARFQDFYKCDHFFFPRIAKNSEDSLRVRGSLQDSEVTFGEHLYLGNRAVADTHWLREARGKPWTWTAKLLKEGLKGQAEKMTTSRSLRTKPFRHHRYWVSSPGRVRLHKLGITMRKLRFVWGGIPFVDISGVPERYFLIPLHYRPESSTLTQGFGIEDEDLIAKVVDSLANIDPNISCVVLENPSMIELRKQSFYDQMLRHRNVVLADPRIDTQELIRHALGVLTISGTVALEASLKNVPVHVVGRPDYLESMVSHGLDNVERFLKASVTRSQSTARISVEKYLKRIQSTGCRGSLGWGSLQSPETQAEAVQLMRNLLRLDE